MSKRYGQLRPNQKGIYMRRKSKKSYRLNPETDKRFKKNRIVEASETKKDDISNINFVDIRVPIKIINIGDKKLYVSYDISSIESGLHKAIVERFGGENE